MDHLGSDLQDLLVGQLRSVAFAHQEVEARESSGIEVPAVANVDDPVFEVGIVREKELWLDWVVVRGSDVFLIKSEVCQKGGRSSETYRR